MKEFERVCSEVLSRITPSYEERERIAKLAEEVRLKVLDSAVKAGVDAEVRIDGSVAKDTWLSGEADVDIFMRVPASLSRSDLEKSCLAVAKEAMRGYNVIERFAEHPYIEAWVEGVRVNVVPCYRVERGKWLSATDRTPFHTEYMKSRLDERLKGEVRLLKKLMKGTGIYGAEVKIGGFSGMLCEIITLYYGSFRRTLEEAASWRSGQVIDVEGYYKGSEEAYDVFEGPLIVVDPVDKGRNASAAVTERRMWEFVTISRSFLKKPSIIFFYPPKSQALEVNLAAEKMRRSGLSLIFIVFGKIDAVVDVLWSQLRKAEASLKSLLERSDFKVLRSASWSDERELNVILLELEKSVLPVAKKHFGPPVSKLTESEKFLAKHVKAPDTIAGPWIEGDRLVVEKARKYVDAKTLIIESLKDGGRKVGVPGKVAESLRVEFKVAENEEIVELYKSREDFALFLSQHIEGKPAWLD
jgi:tRNA nucleotidyltransferase (CCA-adding enzyme)